MKDLLFWIIAAMFAIIMAGGSWFGVTIYNSVEVLKTGQSDIRLDIEKRFDAGGFTDSLVVLKSRELEKRIEKCELEIAALKSQ